MRQILRPVLMIFLLAGLTVGLPPRPVGATDAVVGVPCTEAEFDAALATVESTGGGTITFDCGGSDIITFSAQKTISTSVRIDGADLITLSGGDVTRHFHVLAGGSLTLERLILEDGYEDSNTDYDGGSIRVDDGGALAVLDSTLRANRAEFGGAIFVDSSITGISVTIERSTFVENEATNGSGGALYIIGGRSGGPGPVVTITDSVLNDNFATDLGGAIFNGGGSGGDSSGGVLTITGSELLRNEGHSSGGGAIFNDGGGIDQARGGALTITASTLAENIAAVGAGGAIYNAGGGFHETTGGSLTITASTLADNVAGGSGGALYNDGGGFDDSTGGTILIRRSTLAGNQAAGSGGAIYNDGGALYRATGGDVRSTKSTLSGNSADYRGGAVYNSIGANPDTTGATLTLLASTITLNDALVDEGDGLYNVAGMPAGTISARLSIIAENDTAAGGQDCAGAVNSTGRNLDSDGTCQLTRPHDISAGVAQLGPLTDNGGPTATHLPGASSDALDAGPATCQVQDQRGLPRPGGAFCDIGSVEVQPVPPLTLCVHRFTGQIYSPATGICDPAVYYEVDMPNTLSQTFCYDPATGALTHTLAGACPPTRTAHVTPADGDLLTCVSIFTGIHRWVFDHSQCTANETAVVVPAA